MSEFTDQLCLKLETEIEERKKVLEVLRKGAVNGHALGKTTRRASTGTKAWSAAHRRNYMRTLKKKQREQAAAKTKTA